PADDVDLFALELGDHHLDARAARPDAGPHRIHVGPVADHRHLGAVARFAGDGLDLHRAFGDLGDLHFEEALHQPGVAAAEHHLGPALGVADLHHVRPQPVADPVGLARDLLGTGQHRLGAAQLDDDVVLFQALHAAGDHLADAVPVLGEHHPPL